MLMMFPFSRRKQWAPVVSMIAVAALVSAGCNSRTAGYPPLGQVSGVVTSGGQPLPNITVTFQPVAGGRSSAGTTDASGRYTLAYTDAAKGAMVGEHAVLLAEEPDDSDPRATQRVRKGLDRKLSFTVEKGQNVFDIEITGN
jgi:hypothetical protein